MLTVSGLPSLHLRPSLQYATSGLLRFCEKSRRLDSWNVRVCENYSEEAMLDPELKHCHILTMRDLEFRNR